MVNITLEPGNGTLFETVIRKESMDSINKQSPEQNVEDLHGKAAQEKMKELCQKATVCFFCTEGDDGKPMATRPMAMRRFDDEGCLWFLSSKDSHKNRQIQQHSSVHLMFQGSDYSDFLSLYGRAIITYDEQKIKELWSPMLKTWFTEGVDDERISVIKVEPDEGYYWDTKHNQAIGFVKRLAGSMIGQTLDDSIEGKLRP
jgi:general stress protein 26